MPRPCLAVVALLVGLALVLGCWHAASRRQMAALARREHQSAAREAEAAAQAVLDALLAGDAARLDALTHPRTRAGVRRSARLMARGSAERVGMGRAQPAGPARVELEVEGRRFLRAYRLPGGRVAVLDLRAGRSGPWRLHSLEAAPPEP